MRRRFLTALPVFNEASSVVPVLEQVRRYSDDVLVIDDGSTDGTSQLAADIEEVRVIHHSENRGYGAALRTAFEFAVVEDYEIVVTIDCDGQHEPQRIPRFVAACQDTDIVSGSRYLKTYPGASTPPAQRRWINRLITDEPE